MSGRKTTYIRVPEGELARLRREAARASSLSACNDALQRLAARSDEQLRQSRERAEQRRAGQQEEHRAARQRPERRPQPDGESQSQCEAGPQIGWKAPSAEQQLPGYFDGFFHTVFVFASKI